MPTGRRKRITCTSLRGGSWAICAADIWPRGEKIAVTGSIQTRQYDAKDGTKRTAWDIVADEVEFLTPQKSGTDSFGAPTGEAQSGYTEAVSKGSGGADYAQKPHNDYGGFTEVDDDELPF